MKKFGFGVDIGGTTVKIGLFDMSGTILEKWEIPTRTENAGEAILGDISEAVLAKIAEKGIDKDDVQGIGVGVPGPVSPDGTVLRCVNLGWGVFNVENELSERIKELKKESTLTLELETAKLEHDYKEELSKKEAQIKKLGYTPDEEGKLKARNEQNNEAIWAFIDLDIYKEDVERLKRELEEISASIEEYKGKVAESNKVEDIFTNEIPESMKQLQTELVEKWTEWDLNKQQRILKYKNQHLTYRDVMNKFSRYEWTEFAYLEKDQIIKQNEKDAKILILDLYKRIKYITGEVTSWKNITLTQGAYGMPALNGYVEGKEGRCKVESIVAGGPVQRLHIRVLTREIN